METTESVWYRLNEDLLRFIKRRVKDEYEAEDILHNVFRKIHDSLHVLKDEEKLNSWVYQITRHAITDYYRAAAKKKEAEAPLHDDFDIVDMPTENNLNEVVSQWLKGIVEELGEKYREAIMLTELGDLSQKEMAAQLGISVSGAKSRVQRAREMIKEKLLACCHIYRDRLGNVIDFERKGQCCSSCGCG